MSDLEKAEVRFLREVNQRGGLTIEQALEAQEENPEMDFGTGVDAIDVINKYLSLGFLKYEAATGKFVSA